VVIGLAKVTLSVPDDFYKKLEQFKDRLNYSDVFRRAVSEEIKKLEKRGEIIEGLESFIHGKLPNTDDKDKIRKKEVERFTKKWGTPDYITNTEEEPYYVSISKTVKIDVGDQTLAELEVSNSRVLASSVQERVRKGFGEYDLNLYDKNIKPIVEYFKSKGFIIAEEQFLQQDIVHYILKSFGSQGRDRARDLQVRGYTYYGLFAADKEDRVFIASREVKPK